MSRLEQHQVAFFRAWAREHATSPDILTERIGARLLSMRPAVTPEEASEELDRLARELTAEVVKAQVEALQSVWESTKEPVMGITECKFELDGQPLVVQSAEKHCHNDEVRFVLIKLAQDPRVTVDESLPPHSFELRTQAETVRAVNVGGCSHINSFYDADTADLFCHDCGLNMPEESP